MSPNIARTLGEPRRGQRAHEGDKKDEFFHNGLLQEGRKKCFSKLHNFTFSQRRQENLLTPHQIRLHDKRKIALRVRRQIERDALNPGKSRPSD